MTQAFTEILSLRQLPPDKQDPEFVKYYNIAFDNVCQITHYNGNLYEDLADHVRCRLAFKQERVINEEVFKDAIRWAVADGFGDGCEPEIY